jgi:hypothetical protein
MAVCGLVKEDQPYFGQIQLSGGKFGNPPKVIKSEQATVLPYYPDHTVYREECDINKINNKCLK